MLINLKKDTYKLIIGNQVDKYLMKLAKKNKKDFKMLLNSIKELLNDPYDSISLKGKFENERRLRSGDYRIIFRINMKTDPYEVHIVKIGKRSNIYKK